MNGVDEKSKKIKMYYQEFEGQYMKTLYTLKTRNLLLPK